MTQPCLVTIPISHFCERARWSLEIAGIAFDERCNLQIFHRVALKRIGGKQTVPALWTPAGTLTDSYQILEWIRQQPLEAERARIFSSSQGRIHQMQVWGEALAVASRLLIYNWIIPHKSFLLRVNNRHAPPWQGACLRIGYTPAMNMIQKLLDMTPESLAQAHQSVQSTLDWVEGKVNQAPYLFLDEETPSAGQAFTELDLTMATYLAPIAMPPQYGVTSGSMPELAQCPEEFQRVMAPLHTHPASQWVRRVFAKHRRTEPGI